MSVGRVGSLSLYTSTMQDVGSIQEKLATLQQQISSGLKSDDFKGINGQVEQYSQMNARMRETQQYKNNNEVSLARLQTADTAMGSMIDVSDSMQKLILQQRNGTSGDSLFFRQRMEDYLASLADQLNTNMNGRYLFGGLDTGTPPVPDSTVKPVDAGVPDAGYYEGSSDSITFRVDAQQSYEFPVRADNASFQKIFAAGHLALDAYASGNKEDMAAALDLLQEGHDALVGERGNLNYMIVNVEAKNEELTSLVQYWKGLTDKIGNTDVVAATTEVANYEAVLQATFQVYARLSKMHLTDYL